MEWRDEDNSHNNTLGRTTEWSILLLFFRERELLFFSSSLKWRRLGFFFLCVFAPWEKRRGNKFSPLGMSREWKGAGVSFTGHRHTCLYTCRRRSQRERDEDLSFSPTRRKERLNQKESCVPFRRKWQTMDGWRVIRKGDFSVSSDHVSMMVIVFSFTLSMITLSWGNCTRHKKPVCCRCRGIRKTERQDFSSLPLALTTWLKPLQMNLSHITQSVECVRVSCDVVEG